MIDVRATAAFVLLASCASVSAAPSQSPSSLVRTPPAGMKALCRPVMVKEVGKSVQLWRCPPATTSALRVEPAPAPEASQQEYRSDSVYSAMGLSPADFSGDIQTG